MRETAWPEEVTYYCSHEVAGSVIGGGFLWMCDVRNMNDESEFVFAARFFDEELVLRLRRRILFLLDCLTRWRIPSESSSPALVVRSSMRSSSWRPARPR